MLRKRVPAALLFCVLVLALRQSCGPRTRSRAPEEPPELLLLRLQRRHELRAANLTGELRRLRRELSRALALENPPENLENFMRNQRARAELCPAEPPGDEFSVLPFESFTLRRVYQLEPGLSGRPAETPSRHDRRTELSGALEAALHLLNAPRSGDAPRARTYSPRHFHEGLFRTVRSAGTLYDLAFRENTVPDFRRLVFFRPFAPLVKVQEQRMDTSQILVNVIVPLDGSLDSFRRFISHFSDVCVRQDGRTHLTVVMFGSEKMLEVKDILDSISRRSVTLVHLHETFSRSRGLDVAARAWTKSNVLLLFCDVSVRFTADFLNSCRINAEAGRRVFYPVMFSRDHPDPRDQPVSRRDFGFWKDSDFSVTCQYRSDFISAGGFAVAVTGRSADDLRLYRKFLHSRLMVVRAPARGLVHTSDLTGPERPSEL